MGPANCTRVTRARPAHEKRFDEIIDPKKMVGHGVGGS
jgi:hypothetical protein